MNRPLFGKSPPRFGSMMVGVWAESPEQARLLQRVLETGMRDFAGKLEETYLAKCYNELERNIARSKRENWVGWNDAPRDLRAGGR